MDSVPPAEQDSVARPEQTQGPVVVLGMHRSGTSCLTGCLEEAGLELGEVNRQAPHNRKGNRENLEIRALNDDVLAHNRGSWKSPPRSVRWTSDHRLRRDRILETSRGGGSTWGFKDPRTLLVLDGWLECLDDARLVGTFRHPLAVAGSLHERDRFSMRRALASVQRIANRFWSGR